MLKSNKIGLWCFNWFRQRTFWTTFVFEYFLSLFSHVTGTSGL